MEKPMKKKYLTLGSFLVCLSLATSACNLPTRRGIQTPSGTSSTDGAAASLSLCSNPFFPNNSGDSWEYSGNDSLTGSYQLTQSITNHQDSSFTQETNLANGSYSVTYQCTSAGLISDNPVEQYAGILLSSQNAPVDIQITSNTGISLPGKIAPGVTWQQTINWEATSTQINTSGRFVFNYTAVGYENVTVPAGSYDGLRVDTTIQIEVTSLHISLGSYTISSWWAPEIGLVKSEGTSHLSEVNYSNSMELTAYTPAP
jgi:hypothetical protein